jgi:hypothetical protein
MLRPLLGFCWLTDERIQRVIERQSQAITRNYAIRYYASGTVAPGFQMLRHRGAAMCLAHEGLACAGKGTRFGWIDGGPAGNYTKTRKHVLLSYNPANAIYPMGSARAKPHGACFNLGFPYG